MSTVASTPAEQRLSLDWVLEALSQDGVVSHQQVAQLRSRIKLDDSRHPLVIVAEQGWQSASKPSHPLSLERLTRWLSGKCGQPYVRIDPLKIDVNKVAGVVSQAYAAKLKILPVEVTDKLLTVATCEPYVRGWEEELSRIASRQIKRVVVNPNDIDRYLVEFYGVSRSILGRYGKPRRHGTETDGPKP